MRPGPGEVERAARAERAAVLATVVRDVRDLAVAEDAVQEALLAALVQWPRTGVPARPGAWLTVVARREALATLRRQGREHGDPDLLATLAAAEARPAAAIPDAQLELLFACCHPALALDAQVALTLRTVGGLTTPEIARAFLVPEATLAQRLVRAQRRLRDSGIPFAVPPPERMAERLDGVLGVIYLIFTEGHSPSGDGGAPREALCDEAVHLARLVATLLPGEPEALGLGALVLAHDARRPARTGADGRPVPLERQDRRRYRREMVAEAAGLLDRALAAGAPGPYQLQAAIAVLHARAERAEDTDWPQIAALYATLARTAPSPAVDLGHAAALGMAHGPAAGLTAIDELRRRPGGLDDHHLLHATRADLLDRAGRIDEALAAYRRARALSPAGGAAADALERRIAELAGGEGPARAER